jgi:hypothetical protein
MDLKESGLSAVTADHYLKLPRQAFNLDGKLGATEK